MRGGMGEGLVSARKVGDCLRGCFAVIYSLQTAGRQLRQTAADSWQTAVNRCEYPIASVCPTVLSMQSSCTAGCIFSAVPPAPSI